MKGEPVTYVQRQLGHASIQPTVDMYGKWLLMGNMVAMAAPQERRHCNQL